MGLIFKDTADKPTDPRAARLWTILFSLVVAVLALIGLLALVLVLHDEIVSGFRMERQRAMGLLSAAIVCGGLILLILGVRAKKEALKTAANKSVEKPWLKRKDWAGGKIRSSSRKPVLLLWILVLFWCGVSAVILLAVVASRPGNDAAFAGLFAGVSLAVVLFALRTSLAWRRFNRSVFELTAVPAPAGGALQGNILLPGKSRPRYGWHLALRCLRRATTGPVNHLRTTEKILWQDEKWLRPDLPKKGAAATAIPVFFSLPGDRPESTPEPGNGIHWRLEAWARLGGPEFQAAFEVPVFKTGEPSAPPADPALPFQLSLDEIRKQIRSKIRVTDSRDAREFVVPAGRNPVFGSGAAVLWLVWTAIVALLAAKRAPLPLPLVFGAMDLFMLYFVLDLWFRRNRIRITGGAIKIETAWLGFKKENSLKISEVADFLAERGTPVGYATYYDLKLRTRDGNEWTLAKNLGHKPEADWLVAKMAEAAKNVSATNANA
jgi:hypothetical protein